MHALTSVTLSLTCEGDLFLKPRSWVNSLTTTFNSFYSSNIVASTAYFYTPLHPFSTPFWSSPVASAHHGRPYSRNPPNHPQPHHRLSLNPTIHSPHLLYAHRKFQTPFLRRSQQPPSDIANLPMVQNHESAHKNRYTINRYAQRHIDQTDKYIRKILTSKPYSLRREELAALRNNVPTLLHRPRPLALLPRHSNHRPPTLPRPRSE